MKLVVLLITLSLFQSHNLLIDCLFMNSRFDRSDCRKRQLLAALKVSRGIICTACSTTGIPRRTFYNWLQTDREFQDAYVDILESATDFVESKLMEKIEQGSEKAIFFFLRTRGRSRGYREKGSPECDLVNGEFVEQFLKSDRYSSRESRFGRDAGVNAA
jgi:hypothetical protein